MADLPDNAWPDRDVLAMHSRIDVSMLQSRIEAGTLGTVWLAEVTGIPMFSDAPESNSNVLRERFRWLLACQARLRYMEADAMLAERARREGLT